MALVLMIVAPERFRDEELFDTQAELMQAGQRTIVASTRTGLCPGSQGGQVVAELALDQVHCGDYVAVVFVGGGGSKLLFHNADALRIAREMAQDGKIVAAICLAPVILANAGVLNGHQATVAGTEAANRCGVPGESGAGAAGLGRPASGVLADLSGATPGGPRPQSDPAGGPRPAPGRACKDGRVNASFALSFRYLSAPVGDAWRACKK